MLIARRGIKSLRFYGRKPSQHSLLHVEVLPSFLLYFLPQSIFSPCTERPVCKSSPCLCCRGQKIFVQEPSFIIRTDSEATHTSTNPRPSILPRCPGCDPDCHLQASNYRTPGSGIRFWFRGSLACHMSTGRGALQDISSSLLNPIPTAQTDSLILTDHSN